MKRVGALWAFSIVSLFALPACGPIPEGSHAEIVFVNGNIVTVDEDFSSAEALAVKLGKILAVGTSREIRRYAGPSTQTIDLKGRTVIPGIQDSHIHFMGLGRDVTSQAELTFAETAEDILEAMRDLKQRLSPEPGEWLVGNRWDQYKYPQMVTRWELDEIAPENPVWLRRVYRGVAVNTEVLRRMGIRDDDRRTWPAWWLEDPEDFTFEDRIFRETRTLTVNGKTEELEVPTGAFLGSKGSALVTVRPPSQDFEDDVESVKSGALEMLRLGVTAIVDPSSRMGYLMRVYQQAYNEGGLLIRVPAVYEGTFTVDPPVEIRDHFAAIQINNLGNHDLRWRGAKFYADGGAGTRSAWLSQSFSGWEEFEGEKNFGYPVVADDSVREAQYRAALDRGWELHTHVCGDRAMRQTVDLYKKLMDEIHAQNPEADLRWSLIHAYLPIEPETHMVKEMAEYGIIASCNPVFNWQEGAAFLTNLGEERYARTQPFRSYVEAGVLLTSGSDYPVTSHDPWIGMYALLTRKSQADGKSYGPDETLGIEDALRTYTTNGAYYTYEEGFKGSLEAGKAADLVVLDLADIHELEENPELCFQMREKVLLTMVGGEVRYRKPEFAF